MVSFSMELTVRFPQSPIEKFSVHFRLKGHNFSKISLHIPPLQHMLLILRIHLIEEKRMH